jgi:hypothetical protein
MCSGNHGYVSDGTLEQSLKYKYFNRSKNTFFRGQKNVFLLH